MLPSPIRYFILNSVLFFMVSCAPIYKKMMRSTVSAAVLKKFMPRFTVALYHTQVNVMGNHLSGLLLIKKMPDSSTRLVFSNEMGFKFFDFEFDTAGKFKVYSIIKQLDKKPVVITLKKDFELLLMQQPDSAIVDVRQNKGLVYFIYPQTKGWYYYITDSSLNKLLRLQRVSKTKIVVTASMQNYSNGMPDTIAIVHNNFNFTIDLKRIIQ